MTPSVTFSSTVAAASLLVAALHLACTPSEPPPPAEPPRAIERRLTDTTVNERDGNWSPDGQWIVFGSSASGDEDIYKMPAAGGEPQQLTSGPSEDFYPSWSPDGSRILFTSNRSGSSDNVWTMAADGSDLRQVTRATDRVSCRGGHLGTGGRKAWLATFVTCSRLTFGKSGNTLLASK